MWYAYDKKLFFLFSNGGLGRALINVLWHDKNTDLPARYGSKDQIICSGKNIYID